MNLAAHYKCAPRTPEWGVIARITGRPWCWFSHLFLRKRPEHREGLAFVHGLLASCFILKPAED